MSKQQIILIGGGGHCKSVIDIIEAENKFQIQGILDVKEKIGTEISGYKIIGTDNEIEHFQTKGLNFIITIGQIKNADIRRDLYNRLKKINAKMPVVISPYAYVSKNALLGEGTVIMHHALVNAGVTISVNCIINNKALIEHDSVIGSHCHISTAATINGDCNIGEGSFIGSNSVIIQGINVGKNCLIAAGSTLICNSVDNIMMAGSPAKMI